MYIEAIFEPAEREKHTTKIHRTDTTLEQHKLCSTEKCAQKTSQQHISIDMCDNVLLFMCARASPSIRSRGNNMSRMILSEGSLRKLFTVSTRFLREFFVQLVLDANGALSAGAKFPQVTLRWMVFTTHIAYVMLYGIMYLYCTSVQY